MTDHALAHDMPDYPQPAIINHRYTGPPVAPIDIFDDDDESAADAALNQVAMNLNST